MNESIGKSMSIIYRYRQILINHKLKPYDLGYGQYIFLINIERNLGISQKELTKLVMIDKATTAKALKKLEENDYIYRCLLYTSTIPRDMRRSSMTYSS